MKNRIGQFVLCWILDTPVLGVVTAYRNDKDSYRVDWQHDWDDGVLIKMYSEHKIDMLNKAFKQFQDADYSVQVFTEKLRSV